MQGVIEIHGAKQVLNIGDDQIYSVSETCFIPGDIAIYDRGSTKLVKRNEQKVIATVHSISAHAASLYILNFGPNCPFRPKVPAASYQVGNRLILVLHSDGSFVVLEGYSNSPLYDVNCLLDMYRCPALRAPTNTVMGETLYTKTEIVNHNDLCTFTIDPTSSVDFDDAISVDVANNTIYVHIVDIANQKISDSSLERLRNECLSLYLSNEHTEHLLYNSEASFDLSLVVGEERPVITVMIVLDDEGCVVSYDIYRSTIIAKYRFDYETIANAFNMKCGLQNRTGSNSKLENSKAV